MLRELSAAQLAEMDAYAVVELDPEGETARQERLRREAAEKLDKQKNAFIRAAKDTSP